MLIGMMILFLVLGLLLLSGRGAFLIAGYNAMSKSQKSLYNEKALCRVVGGIMLGICFSLLLLQLNTMYSIPALGIVGTILLFVFPIGGILYLNFGKRFLSEGAVAVATNGVNLPSKSRSLITLILVVGFGIFFVYSVQEPTVTIENGELSISGLYGRTLNLSEISDISLLDESMREIGAGRRGNGFGGINIWKGHFAAGLLFVQANSSPTLLIEGEDGPDIYISFRDSEDTMKLFEQLQINFD